MPRAPGEAWRLPADVLVEGADESGVNVSCRSDRIVVLFGKAGTSR